MKVERQPIPQYRYVITLEPGEALNFRDALRRFANALAIPAERGVVKDVLNAMGSGE